MRQEWRQRDSTDTQQSMGAERDVARARTTYRSVSHADHLGETAGLEHGRHQDHVRGCEEEMRQRLAARGDNPAKEVRSGVMSGSDQNKKHHPYKSHQAYTPLPL